MVFGSIRKQTEHVSEQHPWPLHQVPVLTSFSDGLWIWKYKPNKHFLYQLAFGHLLFLVVNFTISGMNNNPEMEGTCARDFYAWFEVGESSSSPDL